VPNRIISDKTWKSRKIREVQPVTYRPEYAWLIPMFEDKGVCEFDPEAIYFQAYGVARPDWTLDGVKSLLEELVRVGLYHRFTNENRTYLFLVGSHEKGLLPKPSERYSKLPVPDVAAIARAASASAAGDPREIATGLGLDRYGEGKGRDSDEHTASSKAYELED
jgi:hypothetical protein